jgi:hypothetical protein
MPHLLSLEPELLDSKALIRGNCQRVFRGSMQVEKLSIRFQMEDMDGFIRTTMAIGGLQRECQADHLCI